MALSPQLHHPLTCLTGHAPLGNQSKYAADDDHKFHRRPQSEGSSAHPVHFQFQPRHQNKLYLPVQEKNQQFSALPAACPDNEPDDQFYVKAVCYTGIITPPYKILLPNKLV